MLKSIIGLLKDDERLAAVSKVNNNGNTVLQLAASNPESLKVILGLYPEDQRLALIMQANKKGQTVLDCADQNLESLKAILKSIPEKQLQSQLMLQNGSNTKPIFYQLANSGLSIAILKVNFQIH